MSFVIDASKLASDKETEYIEALRNQVRALEYSLEQRNEELRKESERSLELKSAFKENYSLLQKRTDELEAAEQSALLAKNALRECQERMTMLSTHLEESENRLREEKFSKENQRQSFQDILERRAQEAELLAHSRDLAATRAAEEAAAERRRLETELLRCQEELVTQRGELLSQHTQLMREAAADSEKRVDSLQQDLSRQCLLADHLKVEVEQLEVQRAEYVKKQDEREQLHRQQESEWRKHVHAARSDANKAQQTTQAALCDLERIKRDAEQSACDATMKHQALAQELVEKDSAVQRLKKGQEAEREKLRSDVSSLVQRLEKAQQSTREREAAADSSVREARAECERLSDELRSAQAQLESARAQCNLSSVVNEQEVHRLREENCRLREDVQLHRNATEHARTELMEAGQRIVALERDKSQLQLDFARRAEELERVQLERVESLVRQTQAARDAAEAQVVKLKADAEANEQFTSSLLRDRDIALAALREAGLDTPLERKLEVESSAGAIARANALQTKNERLTQLVKQMRVDMENLTLAQSQSSGVNNTTQQQPLPVPVPVPPLEESRQAQILIQNCTRLRQERQDALMQLRRQQLRINTLEEQLESERNQLSEARVAAEQLQFQIDSVRRHGAADLQLVRRRLADAEMLAAESRLESDELYKNNIELTRRIEDSQAQLLMLNVNAERDSRPTEINFGYQELIIEQLRQEVDRLQLRLSEVETTAPLVDDGRAVLKKNAAGVGGGDPHVLSSKLKLAVTRLKSLAKENETLKSINNRLTYDLRQMSAVSTRNRTHDQSSVATPMLKKFHNAQEVGLAASERPASLRAGLRAKLFEIENAQYALSRKELAQNASPVNGEQTKVIHDDEKKRDDVLDTLISSVDDGGESLAAVWQLLEPDQLNARPRPSQRSGRNSNDTLLDVASLNVKGHFIKHH